MTHPSTHSCLVRLRIEFLVIPPHLRARVCLLRYRQHDAVSTKKKKKTTTSQPTPTTNFEAYSKMSHLGLNIDNTLPMLSRFNFVGNIESLDRLDWYVGS